MDFDRAAVGQVDVVDDRGGGGDQVEVELPLQPLLDHLHVQHPEEADAEAEAQGDGGLRLVTEAAVVELQLVQGVAEVFELVGVDGVEPGEDERFGRFVVADGFGGRVLGVGHGVADADGTDVLEAQHDDADLPALDGGGLLAAQGMGVHQVEDFMALVVAHKLHQLPLRHFAVEDAHQRQGPEVGVEPGVVDDRLGRRGRVAHGSGNAVDDGVEQVADADAGFGGDPQGVGGVDADAGLDLLGHLVRVGGGKVDLVDDRQQFEVVLHRQVDVGDGLRLDALGSVDDQQRPVGGGEGFAHLVAEVDVAGGVDQVEDVVFAVLDVVETDALGLDGDAPLLLDVHGVHHLRLELPRSDGAALLDDAVRQGAFAVVDVGDNGEIAYVFHGLRFPMLPVEINAAIIP